MREERVLQEAVWIPSSVAGKRGAGAGKVGEHGIKPHSVKQDTMWTGLWGILQVSSKKSLSKRTLQQDNSSRHLENAGGKY